MSFVVQIEFQPHPGKDAEFRRIARALALAASTEPETLRYQWYSSPTPGRYAILEEYVDADAAEAHNGNVGSLLAELFAVGDLVTAALYGELNAYVRDWATGRAGITVHAPIDP